MVNYFGMIISVPFTAFGAYVFWQGFAQMAKRRLIHDIPRSKIRSMAMGIVEVGGKASASSYLRSPFSNKECVYYHYTIEEYRVTRDSKGRTSREWVEIANEDEHIPFFLSDETGKVYVNPDKAEFQVEVETAFKQPAGVVPKLFEILNGIRKSNRNPAQDLQRWQLTALPNPKKEIFFNAKIGERRFYESFITPEEQVYVLGTADNDRKVPGGVVIKKGRNEPTFIISDQSEAKVASAYLWYMWGYFIIGGILFIGGVLFTLHYLGLL